MTTALYLRTSSARQAQGNDAAGQEHALDHWLKGLELARAQVLTFQDSGVTGRTMSRPGFDALCSAIRQGRVKTVAAASLSRFARNVRGLLDFVDLCRGHGCAIVSLKESIDTTTASGKFFITVMAAMSAFESDIIAERTRDGMAAARANGTRSGRKIGRPFTITDEQVQKASELERGGTSRVRVAKALGISRSTLNRRLKPKGRRGQQPVRSRKAATIAQVASDGPTPSPGCITNPVDPGAS